jgi:asparagine synthase (glutamine-hydrolysing)
MSGVCGWSGFGDSGAGDQRLIANMGAVLARFDQSRPLSFARSKNAASVCGLGDSAYLHAQGDEIVAISGAARFINKNLRERAVRDGIGVTFAELYRSQGPAALKLLCGGFTLALFDLKKGSVLLAIDRMAIGSLTYTVAEGCLVFGSSADAIAVHTRARREIDQQSVYNYVYFHMVPGPNTIYRDYQRLLPGEYVMFRGGSVEAGRYWRIRYEENEERPFGELKTEFLELLQAGVRDVLGDRKTGCFLSGGTDSSTLAGILGLVSGEPAHTFSIGFEADGYDEMHYARIAAKHFGTNHHEYYVTPDDVVAAVPQIAAIYDQPFGNSSAVPTFYCARLAKEDGVERLFGGDGGDELFGGNERYAKQYVFSLYARLPTLVRSAILEPAAYWIPGAERVAPLRKLRSYVEQASVPMPARLETYNLLNHLGPQHVFAEDFLAGVNQGLPLSLLDRAYRGADAETQINRMLALDLQFTLADNDLPKVTRSCELAGVGATFPLLDDRIVDFSARLAPELKLRRTKLRYFFKEALRGFLPEEVITKQKHGFGLPFGLWLKSHKPLQDFVYDNLQDLKIRGVIRREFIDELIQLRVPQHAEFFGTMVWVLLMLEQWFKLRQR